MRRRRIILATLVLASALAAGCAPSRGRYDAVSLGMAPRQVGEILGTPRYSFADEWVYTEENPRDLTLVTIRFKDGKVVAKSWQNPEKPESDHHEGPAAN